MSDKILSRVYHPRFEACCEACVFNQGIHQPWCQLNLKRLEWEKRLLDDFEGLNSFIPKEIDSLPALDSTPNL